MEIKVLIENLTYNQNLKAQHGLSMLITDEGLKILFDTGANSDFLCNAIYMNESIKDIDYVVLSHGHYDHTGGLESFLEINKTAKIILSKNILEEKYSNSTGEMREIGFALREKIKNYDNEFIFVDDYYKVSENVEVYSHIETPNEFEDTEKKLFVKKDGEYKIDKFDDEIYLVIKKDNKLNLITGCSHRGIINIITGISDKTGIREYNYIIGGLHLKGTLGGRIGKTLRALTDTKIGMLLLNHCTGINEYVFLKDIFREKADYFHTGKSVNI